MDTTVLAAAEAVIAALKAELTPDEFKIAKRVLRVLLTHLK
jgi:hypothetical protein